MWHDELSLLTPVPQRWKKTFGTFAFGAQVSVLLRGDEPARDAFLWNLLRDDLARLLQRPIDRTDSADSAQISLLVDGGDLPAEGYTLVVEPKGIRVRARDGRGLFHGIQTLLQLVAMQHRRAVVPLGEIVDWPQYPNRWLMCDMGRATWTFDLLKRVVRIAARLKYNGVHLHLHDNELNSVRYDGLPLGSENPWALPVSKFAELIAYAKDYQIQIIPELESWGHVGSLLQHYPHLYGATRPHGIGHTFGVGPETFALLEKIFDPWAAILPDGSVFHVGAEEANWRLLPGADPAKYNRGTLYRILHELAQARAKAHGKKFQTMIWHDWKMKDIETFMPPDLRDEVIAGPWHYHSTEKILAQLPRFFVRPHKMYTKDGTLRSRFICGAGGSATHEFGAFKATLTWAVEARTYPNCLGVDVMFWGTNDVNRQLPTIYFGSHCIWNPLGARDLLPPDQYPEDAYGTIATEMKHWQALFPDADPEAINSDRGEEVFMGTWRWGEKHGQPVLPLWMPEKLLLGDQPDPATPKSAAVRTTPSDPKYGDERV